MATRRYTRTQLLHLRDSPLVYKPENLPSIEQWIDDTQQPLQHTAAATKRQPLLKTGGEASPMGNFSTGQRPSLVPRASRSGVGDDVSLGPPRTTFPSSRNVSRLSDFPDKGASLEATGDDQDTARSRFFSERQSNRKSFHEKEGDGLRDSWTTVRERRNLARDEADGKDRPDRFARRERDQDGERRAGYGDKIDTRWGEKRQNGERGGWRDRERQRREPDWMSGAPAEKNPEWMEDAATGGSGDDLGSMGMMKKAEDFQKWKDERKMKESGGQLQTDESAAIPAEPLPQMKEVKPPAKLEIDGLTNRPFGSWNDVKASIDDTVATPGKSATPASKAKGSRFASMFKETHDREELPTPDSAPPLSAAAAFTGSAEDEAGFKRIMQMLGGTTSAQAPPQEIPSSPRERSTSQSMKQKSRFTGFFDSAPKSPERVLSPPTGPSGVFSPAEHASLRDNRGPPGGDQFASIAGGLVQRDEPAASRPSAHPVFHDNPVPANGSKDQRPSSAHLNNVFLEQPPSRGTATPDINIHNLLAGQRSQRAPGPDKNSEFLLNLLQTKGSRPPSQQTRPDSNFPLWLDQPPNAPEPHAPKPRAPPPPGLFEDQLMRSHPQEAVRPDQQHAMAGSDMHQRRLSHRMPPGFYDEQSPILQQQQQQQQQFQHPQVLQQQSAQRRNYTEAAQQPGRRIGAPPAMPQLQGPPSGVGQYDAPPPLPPPDFMQPPGLQHHHPQAPPPGFNPHMPRHPPGFHAVPNIYQHQHQQQQPPPPPMQSRDPLAHHAPPGYPGPPAGLMQASSPPNAPPGFFAGPPGVPPGFMPPMRSAQDPGPPPGMRGPVRGFDGALYDGSLGGLRH